MTKFRVFALLFLTLFLINIKIAHAIDTNDCEKEDIPQDKISECIDYLSDKVQDLGAEKNTLSAQITQFNNQIQITELKIADAQATVDKLEKEIGALGFKIGYINESVDKVEALLKQRIIATYQEGFVSNLEILATSRDFSDLILRYQYLKQVQENDKKILLSLQQTKSTYANQKDEREEKQAQIEESKKKLEALEASLDQQKSEKQALLEVTKNDETKFQRLLAQAQAEKAIVFGGGTDVYMRDVEQGASIGSIASHSASPGCSTGAHLHFEVQKNGSLENPSNYLKSASYSYSYPESQYSYYGTISPSGDLPWPLNEPVEIHQGYGSHGFAQTFYSQGVHTGIDMDSSSATVKTVKSGKLYGGSYNCSNGKLYYAKVIHDDGLTTWYLHMIPN